MSMKFPPNPTRGSLMTYGGKTWRFDGSVWLRIDKNRAGERGAVGPQGPAGPTGAAGTSGVVGTYVSGLNGVTGAINTSGLTFAFAGISTDGITVGVLRFPDGTSQSSAHAPHEFVASFNGATGAIEGVNSFNGVTGAIDTSSLTLHVAGLSADGTVSALGISGPSAITFDNGEVIRNSPDGSIQIIPSDEGGNHFGIEIDATEWGFGPVINVIDESGTQVTKAIRLDTDITFSNTNVPDGSPARLMFNNGSNRGFQENPNGDGTVMFGVNDNNGHFAVGRKADLSDGDRSMSTSDKTALGMTNPQFLVYSSDSTNANDYIRLEHDQTDANIYSGTGNINLAPAGGVVGISGGTLEANNFVVDGGKIHQKGNETTTHIDMSSAQDVIIKAADDITLNAGDDIFLTADDKVRISHGGAAGDGIIITAQGNSKFQMDGAGTFLKAADDLTFVTIGDLDQLNSAAKIDITDLSITVTEPSGSVAETFDSNYRRNTDVATFTIDASSAIATGAKTNSLYRIPYNATLKNFDVKINATGGLTAAIRIAGPDFGDPLTSGITGCSLGIEGLTGSSTVFDQASVTAGNFVLLDIFSNNSGASAAQAFLTFESR